MEYTTLGATGITVSQFSFGTWRFGRESDGVLETTREEAHELLDTAWKNGVNFIDTSNNYGTKSGTGERWIGDWISDYNREDFVIASKVYFSVGEGYNKQGLSRKHIRSQINETLERLGTDYIDIYYLHRWDDETPINETLRTLNSLVEDGKIHYIGASTMAAWKLTKALWTSDINGWEQITVTQPKFNAVHRNEVEDYLDLCVDQDLAICPWSPLEGGFLTNKYSPDSNKPENSRGDLESWDSRFSDRQWRVLDTICEVATEQDATPAQIALSWLTHQNQYPCIPILGARTSEQLEENIQSINITLTNSQLNRISDAYSGKNSA